MMSVRSLTALGRGFRLSASLIGRSIAMRVIQSLVQASATCARRRFAPLSGTFRLTDIRLGTAVGEACPLARLGQATQNAGLSCVDVIGLFARLTESVKSGLPTQASLMTGVFAPSHWKGLRQQSNEAPRTCPFDRERFGELRTCMSERATSPRPTEFEFSLVSTPQLSTHSYGSLTKRNFHYGISWQAATPLVLAWCQSTDRR